MLSSSLSIGDRAVNTPDTGSSLMELTFQCNIKKKMMEGRDIVCYIGISAKEENDDSGKGVLKCMESSVLDRAARGCRKTI